MKSRLRPLDIAFAAALGITIGLQISILKDVRELHSSKNYRIFALSHLEPENRLIPPTKNRQSF